MNGTHSAKVAVVDHDLASATPCIEPQEREIVHTSAALCVFISSLAKTAGRRRGLSRFVDLLYDTSP
jgi:hypothetical protein